MVKKIIINLAMILSILSCEQPTHGILKKQPANEIIEVTTINNIPIIWKGSLSSTPANPEIGWAYYNIVDKKSYVWDGNSWEILAQDGISIIWKGELPSAPASPQLNWAYYNIIDGNSYIWNGSNWDLLAKAGRDGASGILLWLGSLAAAPSNPSSGYAYYNSTYGISYIWDGNSWEILARDGQNGTNGTNGSNGIGIVWKGALPSSPLSPQTNWAYYNTSDNKSYIWDGDSWEILAESGSSTIMVSISWKGSLTAAPVSPQIGWMYYNSLLGKTYVWDGSSWNIVSQDGQNGQDGTSPEGFLITWKGGLSSAPSSPQRGWAYYNTSQKKSYIWDGSSWQILAQDGAGGSGSGTYGPWLYVILYTPLGNYTQYNTTVMDTVNFGKVGIGSTVRSSTFYIGLFGGESTTFNLTGSPAIQVSGTNADCFTVTQPSATSTVTGTYIMDASIAFTPTSAGTKTATITIPNNSPDNPNFSFTVTGLGSIWPKTYDGGEGDGDDGVTCSITDSQGNLYFVGYGFELVNHHSGSDWWIKKINSSGAEVTSGWNKKIDLYDNYASSSNTHDRPTNAIIDSNDNLIVSDGYNTIKWSPSGTEQWRKDVGGTLYVDSSSNVFIVTSTGITKYNASGTQQWTKAYTGKLAFDSSDNLLVFSEDTIRYITVTGSESWIKTIQEIDETSIAANTWYDAYISAGSIYYFRFNAVNGSSYSVYLNDSSGTKSCDAKISAFWETDSSAIFTNIDSAYSSPRTFTVSRSGYVVVKVQGWVSSSSGSFAVKISAVSNAINILAINSVTFDPSNNIYIAGYGNSLIDQYSKKDAWIKKYDASGLEVTSGWNKKFNWGHSDDDYATKIIFDGTNIIVAGQGNDLINGASGDDGWVKKYGTNGSLVSEFVIPESNATLLRVDSGGNYYFSSDPSSLLRMNKYNALGILQFTLNATSPYIYQPSFAFDAGNNIYISGYGSNLVTSLSEYDWIIKKFNSLGIEQ